MKSAQVIDGVIIEVIESEIAKGGQSVTLKELLKINGVHLLLEIKSDSYKDQSYARIQAYGKSELKWHNLYSTHYGMMETKEGLAYSPKKVTASEFSKDRIKLIKIATTLLSDQ